MLERKPFITTWKTSKSNQKVVMPLYTTNGKYRIDWGDNTKEDRIGVSTHTYTNPGTYKVIVEDISNSEDASFWIKLDNSYSRENILSIDQWGTIKWKTMNYAFSNCTSLIIKAIDAPNLSLVTNMEGMFKYTKLKGIKNSSNFSPDLNGWDVSNVTSMGSMFYRSSFNGDISEWNVGEVTDMSNMFGFAVNFNQDINDWNIGNVNKISYMFVGASRFNSNLENWGNKLGNVTDLSNIFDRASSFNKSISNWNVSKVVNFSNMFSGAVAFNQNIDSWNIGNAENMSGFFKDATSFNQRLTSWGSKLGKVSDMSLMFSGANAFSGDITGWDVSTVENMEAMFAANTSFNQDISGWNISSVTNFRGMFSEATAFQQDLKAWGNKVSNAEIMSYMFDNAQSFNGNISTWKIGKVVSMEGIFTGVKLSKETYDAILTSWSQLPAIQKNVIFDAPLSNYCVASAARDKLINTHQWMITDEGQACSGLIDLEKSEIKALPTNVIISNNLETNFSKIIIKAKDKDGNLLKTGGENIKIDASMGTVSTIVDHRDGTYSANLSASQKGTSQVFFGLNGQNTGKTTLVSFIEPKGCKLRFNINADQRIIEAKGRYRKVSDEEWNSFTIENLQGPTTILIEEAGFYELQVQVSGINKKWTEWYPSIPMEFGVNVCKLEGIPIKINKGWCWDLSNEEIVFVNPDSITYKMYDEIQIKEGLIFYLGSILKVPYNGNNHTFTYGYQQFKINENGELYDLGFCEG